MPGVGFLARASLGLLFGGFCGGAAAALPGSNATAGARLPVLHCYTGVLVPDKDNEERRKHRQKVFAARFEPYVLAETIPMTHDVALFRFLLHDPEDEFNLKPCSTLQACHRHGTQLVDQCYRFYTPVTQNGTKGYFDIIVKRKSGGQMTEQLFGLHVGDTMLFRNIAFKITYKPNRWKEVGMIAGGTGFTPMLQVIRHALKATYPDGTIDRTKLSFLFCNRTERHILLKGLFDQIATEHPDRFRVNYCVDQAIEPATWKGYTGFITEAMVRETLPPPEAPGSILMVCGPDSLLTHSCGNSMAVMDSLSGARPAQPVAADLNNLAGLGGVLGRMGYSGENVYRF